jgi:hypothetical protein
MQYLRCGGGLRREPHRSRTFLADHCGGGAGTAYSIADHSGTMKRAMEWPLPMRGAVDVIAEVMRSRGNDDARSIDMAVATLMALSNAGYLLVEERRRGNE